MFYRPTSLWPWTLLVATVIEIGIVVPAETAMFSIFSNMYPETAPTFIALFIFGSIYQAMIVYDTLAQQNTVQLGGLCAFATCLCIYAVLQTKVFGDVVLSLHAYEPKAPRVAEMLAKFTSMWSLSIVTATATGAYTLIITLVGFQLHKEFQWTIYRQLNADLVMQRRYFTFKIYTTVLKFDFFFFFGFIIQLWVNGKVKDYVLTIGSMPATFVILIASTWFMRRENRAAMIVVLISHVGLLAFFIFKIVRIRMDSDFFMRRSLVFFAVMTIFLSLVTIGFTTACMRNFNKGLKVHISSRRVARSLLEDHEMEILENRGDI